MRLLHTSDWHLGRSLHGQSLLDAQATFVEFVVDVVRDEGIDAVLVAGDVYDRAIPPVEAVELFDEMLRRIAALRVPIVLISGNHDSRQPPRVRIRADRRRRRAPPHRSRPAPGTRCSSPTSTATSPSIRSRTSSPS